MKQELRDAIAELISQGREDEIYWCGCSGCPIERLPNGKPSGEQCQCAKRCKCQCTLPDQVQRRAEFQAEVDAIRTEVMEARYEALENDGEPK